MNTKSVGELVDEIDKLYAKIQELQEAIKEAPMSSDEVRKSRLEKHRTKVNETNVLFPVDVSTIEGEDALLTSMALLMWEAQRLLEEGRLEVFCITTEFYHAYWSALQRQERFGPDLAPVQPVGLTFGKMRVLVSPDFPRVMPNGRTKVAEIICNETIFEGYLE